MREERMRKKKTCVIRPFFEGANKVEGYRASWAMVGLLQQVPVLCVMETKCYKPSLDTSLLVYTTHILLPSVFVWKDEHFPT